MKTRESADLVLRTLSFKEQANQIYIPIATAGQGIMLGFQPFGVTSCPLDDGRDLLVISAYYESAVCLAKVRVSEHLEFEVEWVRGAKNTVRLFPDLDPIVGGNRCYVAYINGGGNLVVGRGERKLYVLERDGDGKWEYNGKLIQLPDHESGDHFYVVYANEISPDVIETNEHDGQNQRWQRRRYLLKTSSFWEKSTSIDVSWFCHQCAPRGEILTVLDHRMLMRSESFFDIGTGVAPLSNGGGYVIVDYGQYDLSTPFGAPGSLTYVPPAS